ncbi:MAG: sigma-70 family RNA polymerase sigma factor [Ignavibacteria bacterium]|nr:sigma-70 family RNA polymerase sigma factor [Ignavibacteria bacterium]
MKNDAAAFGKLIQAYRIQLFSYLLRLCGDRMTAEDLFQETLIKVWKGFKSYNEQNKFSSWLFSIAHNVAVDSIRKESANPRVSSFEDVQTFASDNNPHNIFVEKEINELVMAAFSTLSEKQKQVFLLRQHSGMTFKEISKVTNQPLNTVLGHMHYAVSGIRKKLSKDYG